MNAQNVVVQIIISAQGAQAGVQQHNAAMQTIVRQSQHAAKESAFAFSSIFGANFFADLAANFVRSFSSALAAGVIDVTKYAARTQELGFSLEALAKANKLSNAEVREQEEALRRANITTQASKQVLAEFIAVGLPLEKASPLATVAKDLGVIAGLNSSEEFKALIDGIQTLNVRVLRNAGVFIRIEEVERQYAATIGKTTDTMSEQEKQLAVLNAVIDFGSRVTGTYDAAMQSAAKQMRSLERVSLDFKDALGQSLTPAMLVIVEIATQILKVGTAAPGAVYAVAASVAVLTASIVAMNTAQIASLPVISQAISSISLLGKVMVGTAGLAAGQTATLLAMTAGWGAVALAVGGLVYGLYQYSKTQTEIKEATTEEVNSLLKKQATLTAQKDQIVGVTASSGDLTRQQEILTGVYSSLNVESQARVTGMGKERSEAEKLRLELERLLRLKKEEITLNARIVAQGLVTSLQAGQQGEQRIQGMLERIAALQQIEAQLRGGRAITQQQAQTAPQVGLRPFLGDIAANDLNLQLSQVRERSVQLQAAVKELRGETNNFNDSATIELEKLQRLGTATGQSTEQLVAQAFQYNLLNGNQAQAIALVNAFAAAQAGAAKNTQTQTNALEDQIAAIEKLGATQRQGERRKVLKGLLEEIAEGAKTPAEAQRLLSERRKQSAAVNGLITEEQRVQQNLQKLDEEVGLKKAKATRAQKSEAEQLSDRVRKLNADVLSFSTITSKEFVLRFRAENLERQKRDLERILDLRRDLNLEDQKVALPRDAEGARQQVAAFESMLRVRDGVRKVIDEQQDAEEQLAIAMRSRVLPVLNAGIRAELDYAKAVRQRRSDEQQLTADLIVAEKLRTDALNDQVGTTKKAYQSLKTDLLKQLTELEQGIEQNKIFEAIQAGGELKIEQQISGRINLEQPRVPTELQNIADHAKSIRETVFSISQKMPGASSGGPWTLDKLKSFVAGEGFEVISTTGGRHNKGSLHYLGQAADVRTRGRSRAEVESLIAEARAAGLTVLDERTRPANQKVWGGPHVHLSFGASSLLQPTAMVGLAGWQPSAGIAQQFARKEFPLDPQDKRRAQGGAGGIDVISTQTTLSRLTVEELEQKVAIAKAEKARGDANRAATEQIKTNEAALHHQLIDLDLDLKLARSTNAIEREKQERQTTVSIALLNDQLHRIEVGDAQELRQLAQNADEERLRSRVSLYQQIAALDSQIAHAGEDAALKEAIAFKEAQLSIVKAHEDAAASIIRSQVAISQQTVYSADIANSKVLELIAQQKGVTEIIAGAKTGVIQTTYDLIDRGLDSITRKLGVAGSLVKDIAGSFLKLLANQFFLRLFGLTGAGGGGGGFNPLNLVTGLLQPGARPGTSSLTGGFAGGPGGGGFLSSGPGQSAGQSVSQIAASNLFRSLTSRSGLGFLPSLTQQANSAAVVQQASQLAGAGQQVGQAATGLLGSGLTASSLAQSLGPLAPLLGLQLGIKLGGQSRLGQMLGGLGGGVAGLAILLGGLGPAAVIAAPLLIGAYLLARNDQRRRDETQRAQILGDAKQKIDTIIAQVKGGKLDGVSALAQAMAIRQEYLNQVGQIKDSKTRNIALATVREIDARIELLKSEAARADRALELDKKLVPTFDVGGTLASQGYRVTQPTWALVHPEETVITPAARAALGGPRAMARANVRGYSDGSHARSAYSQSSRGSVEAALKNVVMLVVPSEDVADAFITKARSDTLAIKVRTHVQKRGKEGLGGDILNLLLSE